MMLSAVRITTFLLALATLIFAGCKNDSPAASGTPQRSATPERARAATSPLEIPKAESGHPQPRLVTVKLWLGTNEVTAEIAHTMPQIMAGMMWRTNMAEMEGMLFVFPQPHRAQFWMRNTLLP